MKIVIKNSLQDLLSFGKHLKIRDKLFEKASSVPRKERQINVLSKRLHPVSQDLVIDKVIEESPDIRSFILRPSVPEARIAPFRAGQYLVLLSEEEGLILRRPYSISSSPAVSVSENYYRITVKFKPLENNGFFSDHVFRLWKRGTRLKASGPQGSFYYSPLRDASRLVCIAGGSGITPFCSIIPDLLQKERDSEVHLFYGYNRAEDEVFAQEFNALGADYSKRFFYHPHCLETQGIINSGLIKKILFETAGSADSENTPGDLSFFICGPEALQSHMNSELRSFSLKPKFIRRESYGRATDNDPECVQEYKLSVKGIAEEKTINAFSNESLLTALERGGIDAPSLCRAGECGWCRAQLLSGDVTADHGLTGIRQADQKFAWIHPCISYPLGDIIIKVNENPG